MPELRPRRAGLGVETQQRIIELYSHRGASLRSVAEQVYVHPNTVSNILEAADIPRKPIGGSRERPTLRTLTTEQLLQVGELYAQGLTLREIAEHLEVSRSAVAWRLKRLGGVKRTRSEAARLGHRTRRARAEDHGPPEHFMRDADPYHRHMAWQANERAEATETAETAEP